MPLTNVKVLLIEAKTNGTVPPFAIVNSAVQDKANLNVFKTCALDCNDLFSF